MRTFRKLLTAMMVLMGPLSMEARAFTVSPLQLEMTSAGQRSRGQITVVNDGETPMPVEAVVQRLSLDEAGRQTTSKAGEEFLVMPPQAIIPPGATQNFRIQWLGEPMLAKSESFVLAISQVPVKLEKSKPRVQVVMALGVMINVAPPEGAPALNVVGTGVTTERRDGDVQIAPPYLNYLLRSFQGDRQLAVDPFYFAGPFLYPPLLGVIWRLVALVVPFEAAVVG